MPLESHKLHEIRDPVHTFVRIETAERLVANSAPYQRLRYIHQLAMTFLVYPGAVHTRFEHCLGVMELASRIYDVATDGRNLHPDVRNIVPPRNSHEHTRPPWGGERDGYFFCARVGDRVYLRFVPSDGAAVLKDALICIRLISCTEQTERVLSQVPRESANASWQRARQDIYEEWTFATDPVNLQPKVRPVLKRAADAVRKFPLKGLDQEAIDTFATTLEAPWGARIEKRIREALGEGASPAAAAMVIAAVKELGLKPYQAPEPLPPIHIDEVDLICWMAVSAEGGNN